MAAEGAEHELVIGAAERVAQRDICRELPVRERSSKGQFYIDHQAKLFMAEFYYVVAVSPPPFDIKLANAT